MRNDDTIFVLSTMKLLVVNPLLLNEAAALQSKRTQVEGI